MPFAGKEITTRVQLTEENSSSDDKFRFIMVRSEWSESIKTWRDHMVLENDFRILATILEISTLIYMNQLLNTPVSARRRELEKM